MAIADAARDGVLRVADVLMGGDSEIPVPATLDAIASRISIMLSSDFIPNVPYVDLTDLKLARAVVATILPPLVWNLIGPFEYHTRLISRITLRPIVGVYLSGTIIAGLSVYRSALFVEAINGQPRMEEMGVPMIHALGGFFGMFGLSMFLGAYYQLGITGTYLGDYFGILREEMITAFPFRVLKNPMYDGSSMLHFAEALLSQSPSGLLLAGWLFFCYRLGCIFEEPFTAKMYAERDEARQAKTGKSQ